jgi:hypothetical protein
MTATCLPDANLDWAATLDAFKVSMEADKEYRLVRAEQHRLEAEVESDVTIIEPRHEIPIADLPRAAKILATRAEAAGWTVAAGRSGSHKRATLYASDSAQDAKVTYRAGDVRYPAEDRTHFVVNAMLSPEVGFRVYYTTRPNGLTTFIVGDAKDPVSGRMSIFDATTVKAFSAEADLTNVMTPTDFADWFDTLVPPAKPRAPRKTKEERTVAAMLAGEEIQL